MSRVEDASDVTCALAALVYFKLKQQLLGGAKQFEVVAIYKINQKWLSEILHGKKYLGGKQAKHRASGTKDNPKVVDDESKEKAEEEKEEDEEEEKHEDQETQEKGGIKK